MEEEDFHVIAPGEAVEEVSVSEPLSTIRTRRPFASLYLHGKYKLLASVYNLVHSHPTELPAFSESTVVLLGRHYVHSAEHNHVALFVKDFHSLLWFTYRKDFPPLETSQLTTDIGWGCMLRTAQMMLGALLLRHLLGPAWRVTQEEQLSPYSMYRKILRWFADLPSPKCPYSIHNFVACSKTMDSRLGETLDKVGEWFSPTRVSVILKQLVRDHSPEGLTMYVAKESVVYISQVVSLCTCSDLNTLPSPSSKEEPSSGEDESSWRPIFIMVPVRLGVEKLNRTYISSLKAMLQMPQSVGILGGRPRQSLYFVACQDDYAFFLDPHVVRPSAKVDENTYDSYHCNLPQKMPFENLDPSLAIGFYCANKKDFLCFCESIQKIAKSVEYPVFTVEEICPSYADSEGSEDDVVIL